MQNYRLTLAYDGTRYRGWQRLPPPAKTVQASVETALGEIFGQPLEISGSGRTDAGVNAACQVASFHARSGQRTRCWRSCAAFCRRISVR